MAEPNLEPEERLHQVEQLLLYLLLNLKSDDRLIELHPVPKTPS